MTTKTITYSVLHGGTLRGLGLYSGPGLTLEKAEADAIECARVVGGYPIVTEDRETTPAQATYYEAYLDEMARQGGVTLVPRVMRHRQKNARRAARAAVIDAHGQDSLDAAGQPR